MALSRLHPSRCEVLLLASALLLVTACSGDDDTGLGAGAVKDGSGGSSGAAANAGAGGSSSGGGTSGGGGGTSGGGGEAGSSQAGSAGSSVGAGGGAGGSAAAGAPAAGAGGMAGGPAAGAAGAAAGMAGAAGGLASCVGAVDDTEPNETLVTAHDLGDFQPEFDKECGGTVPTKTFDGSIGPGDVDFAIGDGKEPGKLKCGHTPRVTMLESAKANVCLTAKCDSGTATFTCSAGMGVDLGNGYVGCCADMSAPSPADLVLSGYSCSGDTNEAKIVVRVTPLAGATTCEPYGMWISF